MRSVNMPTFVAPHVGAWIEIVCLGILCGMLSHVAPHVGAWIEIATWISLRKRMTVAPHVGAWIEMHMPFAYQAAFLSRRTPCGCVD